MEKVKDVHTEHCCVIHGCQYRDEDCSVVTEEKPQSFPCEACDYALENNIPESNALIEEYERVRKLRNLIGGRYER